MSTLTLPVSSTQIPATRHTAQGLRSLCNRSEIKNYTNSLVQPGCASERVVAAGGRCLPLSGAVCRVRRCLPSISPLSAVSVAAGRAGYSVSGAVWLPPRAAVRPSRQPARRPLRSGPGAGSAPCRRPGPASVIYLPPGQLARRGRRERRRRGRRRSGRRAAAGRGVARAISPVIDATSNGDCDTLAR